MFTKKQEKFIRSLQQKKFRKQENVFIVEGLKLVNEAIESRMLIRELYFTAALKDSIEIPNGLDAIELTEIEIKRISSLTTAPGVLALLEIPSAQFQNEEVILFLDGVSDPGNMGTIIRTAEGFGLKQIVCSLDCVDIYSTKVVQATMGSLFRMRFDYRELADFIESAEDGFNFYAADMHGENIYTADLKSPAIFILGNESKGISATAKNDSIQQLSIPISKNLESLNVAISNAVILSEFRRRFPL